ncbi:hypothetical protein AB9F42_36090, partial [Rhizobium leguminosarum]|uniref:hypothetical protein n=1 Tax=Rhizobium leguminosarum TaxID=384 RepID=UPI003F9D2BC5
VMREMILAVDEKGRRLALYKLLPMQRLDFTGLFTFMHGLPVTIRLLDPPLHGCLHAHGEGDFGHLVIGLRQEFVQRR